MDISHNGGLIYNIQVSKPQLNVLIAALAKLPYEIVAPLMNDLSMQIMMQEQQHGQHVGSTGQANGGSGPRDDQGVGDTASSGAGVQSG
jgi:hypothetical protein